MAVEPREAAARTAVGAVLVAGGGIGGIQAALDLAEAGYQVHLVTKDPSLGGHMAQLDKTFPTNECSMCLLGPKMTDVFGHPNVTVHTLATLVELRGRAGDFTAVVRKEPRYVDLAECTACGECEQVCPVSVPNTFNAGLDRRRAISKQFPQAVPNKYYIEKRGVSPCRTACPAGVNVQAYVSLIARGRFFEAWEVIRRANPFPLICGTVCHHPCETVCQRGDVDEPLAIQRLKRFVGEYVLRESLPEARPDGPAGRKDWTAAYTLRDEKVPREEKVAVVGSGPAGLSCAYHLARRGYPVTVFEALPVIGGMLRVGIPEYRLPRRLLEAEIELIRREGVEIRTNVAVGTDKSLEDLFAEGYRAVFLGIGAHEPTRVGIPGEDLPGVYHGVSFLRRVNLGERLEVGRRVVVVGGGNTAVDCARTALRLGAEEVTVVYRRTRAEMTALPEEVEDALDEGVRFEFLAAPVQVVAGASGRVAALRCVRNRLGEPDASGRPRPVPIPGSESDLPADSVVIAISQAPDLLFLADSGLERERSLLVVDPYTLQTNRPGVFAGGDAVTGPATVVAAVAAGKEAAESIHRYLRGLDLREGRTFRVAFGEGEPVRKLPVDTRGVAPRPRVRQRKLDARGRRRSFDEVCLGMTEEEAVAEAGRCLACGVCCECLLCEKACERRAVRHDDRPETLELRVGAVILAPGYATFDPEPRPGEAGSGAAEFGYGVYPNVVTALEFERMLSSTGPWAGELVRPSDRRHPRRIAFIQCVGSRDRRGSGATSGGSAEGGSVEGGSPEGGLPGGSSGEAEPVPYCSAVCCMFSTKQAIIAREHDPDVECTVFYIDLRAQGKNFERYVESAERQFGVTFRRSMVSGVREDPATRDLTVTWTGPDGRVREEVFDLVVLATGLRPPAGARDLARAAGVELGPHGFLEDPREAGLAVAGDEGPVGESALAGLDPCATTRPGVFAAGAFQGPRDIPETVVSGSAAAGSAGTLLAVARGTLAREKVFPPERDVSGEEPRVGVFVCRCGINIASVVDVQAVVEAAARLPGVALAKEFLFTCSQDSVRAMQDLIREHGLNRVVVASCTVRTHGPLFREMLREVELNQFLFHMVNIREECSWVHKATPKVATAKAVELVAAAVAKACLLEPLRTFPVPVVKRALVVGGGVAGLGAALTLAGAGFPVTVVEREDRLGGNLRHLHSTLEVPDAQAFLETLLRRVESHPLVTVLTGRRLADFGGHAGHFRSVLEPGGETVEHGTLVVATGHREWRPSPDAYPLYGRNPRVLTRLDFERRLVEEGPDWLGGLGRVAFLQCVGSRGEDRPENYCSRTCCSQAVKNALLVRQASPGAEVFVVHRDVRTYGFREEAYREAREKGVVFVRREEGRPPRLGEAADGRVLVAVADADLRADLLLPCDLVVLSTGVEAAEGATGLAGLLKVTLNEDGFFVETHAKLAPMDLTAQGVFICGGAHAPKTIVESLMQGVGAAARAATVLAKDSLVAGGIVATVDAEKCAACLTCVRVCPFKVPFINDRGVAEIDPVQCRGCGTCAGECPAKAIHLPCYRDDQMRAAVEALFRAAGR